MTRLVLELVWDLVGIIRDAVANDTPTTEIKAAVSDRLTRAQQQLIDLDKVQAADLDELSRAVKP